jgi:hypothetical protein
MGGRHRHLAEAVEPIFRPLLARHVHLMAEHVPGVQNERADELSRQSVSLRHEWELSQRAVDRLVAVSGPLVMDWFATAASAKAPRFASQFPDPRALVCDALSTSWHATSTCHLFSPPFPLIEKVVRKLVEDQGSGWLIVPHWPTRPFFGTLSLLPVVKRLELPPSSLCPHPQAHVMRNGRSPPLLALLVSHPHS